DLSGANLSDAHLDGADLSGAILNRTSLRLANLSNAQLTGVQWRLRAMRGCYLGIRGLDSCFGNALFKRAAADQDFLDTLEAHLKGTRGMALFRAWGVDRLRAQSVPRRGDFVWIGGDLWRGLQNLSTDPRLQGQRKHLVHALLFLDRHLYDTGFW